jgi:hypothetical protein
VGLFNLVELEPVHDQRPEIGSTGADRTDQATHPLLAARAERDDDLVVAEAGAKAPSAMRRSVG